MNLKGLTAYQAQWLHSWLIMQVDPDEVDTLLPLVEASVGRIAANNIRRQNADAEAGGVNVSYPQFGRVPVQLAMIRHDAYEHVLDWLRASLVTSAPWLANVDERGCPRKLLKCSTYDDLVREADKAMDRVNAWRARALRDTDEEHVADLAKGFTLVRLLTPAALDLESARMKHCVGHGAYDRGLEEGTTAIYSLRDPLGRPVVTIEVEEVTTTPDECGLLVSEPRTRLAIQQVRGKRNEDPAPAHLDILRPFVMRSGWRGREHWWPTITDAAGVEHDAAAIPPGTNFARFYLSHAATARGLVRLPDGLTVTGDCYIGGPLCAALPERMTVGGDLYLSPVGGDDRLSPDDPMTLPGTLQVGGKIVLWDASAITAPEHLRNRIVTRAIHVLAAGLTVRFEDWPCGVDLFAVIDEPEPGGPRP